MGCEQGEQPLIREEGIWPLPVIHFAASHRRSLVLLAQDRTQPPPDKLVEPSEQAWSGVFEVTKPSPQLLVDPLCQ
jgi:hypothetical protein